MLLGVMLWARAGHTLASEAPSSGRPVEFERIATDMPLPSSGTYVIHDRAQFEALWRREAGAKNNFCPVARDLPATPWTDYSKDDLLVVAIGQLGSTGYDVRIATITELEDRVAVQIVRSRPGSNCLVGGAMTCPQAVVSVPKIGKPIRFTSVDRTKDCYGGDWGECCEAFGGAQSGRAFDRPLCELKDQARFIEQVLKLPEVAAMLAAPPVRLSGSRAAYRRCDVLVTVSLAAESRGLECALDLTAVIGRDQKARFEKVARPQEVWAALAALEGSSWAARFPGDGSRPLSCRIDAGARIGVTYFYTSDLATRLAFRYDPVARALEVASYAGPLAGMPDRPELRLLKADAKAGPLLDNRVEALRSDAEPAVWKIYLPGKNGIPQARVDTERGTVTVSRP